MEAFGSIRCSRCLGLHCIVYIHAWWKLGIKNDQHEINGTSIYQIYESKTDLNPHLSDLVTLPATIEIMLKLGGAKGRHVVK